MCAMHRQTLCIIPQNIVCLAWICGIEENNVRHNIYQISGQIQMTLTKNTFSSAFQSYTTIVTANKSIKISIINKSIVF